MSSSVDRISSPQSRCRIAVGRCDITPPVGIYHRMWGAALHDQASGVHRPLLATLVWLEPIDGESTEARVLVSLDHCILDKIDIQRIQESIASKTGLSASSILVTLTHTHGSGLMTRTRSHLPGGDMIGPYLDGLAIQLGDVAEQTRARVEPAVIVYGVGRCALAKERDYWDAANGRYVCGFNPKGHADDTLIVARMTSLNGKTLGTIVNYACHPTTLAWQNTLISPDWIGSMRELIEREEQSPCLFLQGASGDLGPQNGFVGDPAVADQNGRIVGHSALATLETVSKPGMDFCYRGPVVSGAVLGTWEFTAQEEAHSNRQNAWQWNEITVNLPYRADLPSIEQTIEEKEYWLSEESAARQSGDEARLQYCRAQQEQRTRQLARLNALVPGPVYPFAVQLAQLGDAIFVFTPGELYQEFQIQLRARFAAHPVLVTTLTNDWQPGYVPPAEKFGHGIYQEIIAATAPGAAEHLTQSVINAIEALLSRTFR